MTIPRPGLLLTLAFSLLAQACGDPSIPLDEGPRLLRAPIALGDRLLLVDVGLDRAIVVPATSPDVPVALHPLPAGTVDAQARLIHPGEALILSKGVSGGRDVLESPGALTMVDGLGDVTTFPLGSASFTSMVQQPAGDFVALLRGTESEQVLQNVNELAFVHLEGAPEDAVRPFTLPEAPLKVFFSEGSSLDGNALQLAVVLTRNMAAVFDLERADTLPVIVQLSAALDGALDPDEAYFDLANERIYIRSRGTDDIFSLRLVRREGQPELTDFTISIDIIAAGRRPTDLQFFELDGVTHLSVLAPGSQSLVLVEVATSRTISVRLPTRFSHARVYEAADADGSPSLFMWEDETGRLATVKLSLSTVALDRSYEELPTLPSSIWSVETFDDGKVVFFARDRYVSLVDPRLRSVTPYRATYTIQSGLLDAERRLLWFAPVGTARVARLSLDTGATEDLPLDDEIAVSTLVPGASRLAVLHENALGHVTFVDLDTPSRANSFGLRGFLLGGLFD